MIHNMSRCVRNDEMIVLRFLFKYKKNLQFSYVTV